MAVLRTGGCTCGAVRYTFAADKAFKPYACHCSDCHSRSGSAFTVQMFVPREDFVVSGELAEGINPLPSGTIALQYSCAKCLTRIYGDNPAFPFVTLRAGTLDDSQGLIPAVHLWTSSKQSWVVIPQDVPSYSTQPENALEWVMPLAPPQSAA